MNDDWNQIKYAWKYNNFWGRVSFVGGVMMLVVMIPCILVWAKIQHGLFRIKQWLKI